MELPFGMKLWSFWRFCWKIWWMLICIIVRYVVGRTYTLNLIMLGNLVEHQTYMVVRYFFDKMKWWCSVTLLNLFFRWYVHFIRESLPNFFTKNYIIIVFDYPLTFLQKHFTWETQFDSCIHAMWEKQANTRYLNMISSWKRNETRPPYVFEGIWQY